MFNNLYSITTSFMNELPPRVQKAAMEIYNFSSLKEMLEMRLNGPNHMLKDRYEHSIEEWNFILNAVILTKLSYFEVQFGFPNLYIDRLIEISGFCLGFPDYDAKTQADIVQREHPTFADWLRQLEKIKQQNRLFAKHQAQKN